MNDDQVKSLTEMLKKKKKIWCMNLGENYNVSTSSWVTFCHALPMTHITHLYISEHVITTELKIKLRANIRENRKKHDKHCSLKNIHVIEKCTNMWWNPINAIRHQFAADIAREVKEREEREREEKEERKRINKEHLAKLKRENKKGGKVEKVEKGQKCRFKRPLDVTLLTPSHSEYWAEGVGEGGEKPWKFNCSCGEKCSSYENFRYHPVGRMYECTNCSIWSHVKCNLGNIDDDDLEELSEVLCSTCRGKLRRQRLVALGEAGISMGNNGIPLLNAADGNSMEDDDDEEVAEGEEDDEEVAEGEGSIDIGIKFRDSDGEKSGVDFFYDADDDKVGSSSEGCTSSKKDHDGYDDNHSEAISSSSEDAKNIEKVSSTVNNSNSHVGQSILSRIDDSSNNVFSESTDSAPSSSSLDTVRANDPINGSITHELKDNISLLNSDTSVNSSALKIFDIGDPQMTVENCEGSELDS
eukprot:CAMPEP_0119046136 /NCGR_PEP_ID=MMETSP1177-20130426/44627_1 /TAXON_ID=2985 /ORGANISM="Ochromonas sp, Strain CCMP1899" /LENGTH=470 /DNA_ID=CAMNT_0007018857 /DNA_START=254 /DNA_END=1666 /DNA_ORIENTATION=+